MLVKSVKPFKDYTGTQEFPPGRFYVVYAIEHDRGALNYYLLPLGVKHESGEYDPLAFDSSNFEVVKDVTSHEWETHEVGPAHYVTTVTSFPEWFENEFYIRAHDWDLEDDDYIIVRKYKKKYEELYKDYIKK